jgi:multiple sugar transport system substrate-binding protein
MKQQRPSSILTRRSFIAGAAGTAAGLTVASRALGAPSSRFGGVNPLLQDKPEIVFTYWGSPQEQEAVKQMTEDFNDQADNIKVKPQYVNNDGYDEKMTTMLAGGTPPDVAYMGSDMAFQWAVDGKTLDLKPWVDADPETPTLIPDTTYTYDDGKILSTSLAIGIHLLYWNHKIFEEAGVDAPPTTGETAWTWDQFVENAKLLTKDGDGRNATDPDFDASNIRTYGTTVPYWLPMVWSNGGALASEDGTQFLLSSPESIEVFQALQDLIYVHHVSPTPAAAESLPATDILMRTGKLAMDINGMWKTLDYANSEGLEWGMGVLPKFKEPITQRSGIPIIISANCQYPDQAYEFYRWRYSPERIDLYARGLWMPIQSAYYTEEDKIAQWIVPEVYPAEARQVLVDYALNFAPKKNPTYWLKNQNQLYTEAITPNLQKLFANEGSAQDLLTSAASTAQPLMQGRW